LDETGRVAEAFTPDFYLPDLDLYLELTTLKQSLVTDKNRKIRKFRNSTPTYSSRSSTAGLPQPRAEYGLSPTPSRSGAVGSRSDERRT